MIERCLFVGLGGIGQRHLRNLRALRGRDVRLAALRSRKEQLVFDDSLRRHSADVADVYGVELVDDLDAALAFDPQVVFVTNPSSLHVEIARAAVDHGADLFVEKPLSHSLEGVNELVRAAREKSLIGYVGYQLRKHPGVRRLQALLNEQALGRVLYAQAHVGEYLPDFHPDEDYRRMYAARRDLGGGVVLSQIHEIDLLYSFFGMPSRVVSLGGHISNLEIDVEDVAGSLLEFDAPGRAPILAELHQDFVRRPKRREIFVCGQAGSAELCLSAGTFVRYDERGSVVESESYADFPRNTMFLDELEEFLGCVERREAPSVDLAAGRDSLRIALALLSSQARRAVVEIGAE